MFYLLLFESHIAVKIMEMNNVVAFVVTGGIFLGIPLESIVSLVFMCVYKAVSTTFSKVLHCLFWP